MENEKTEKKCCAHLNQDILPSSKEEDKNLPIPPEGVFTNQRDVYNTRYIDSSDLPATKEEFEKKLDATLEHFRSEKVKGVFLEMNIDQCSFIIVAKEKGFTFHHTNGNYLTMQTWLREGKSRLPAYASHYVGVGGLTIDFEKGKVLVIKEKSGNDTSHWKMPGGLADEGEFIGDAATREVWEETGINTKFLGIVSLREKKPYIFGRSDIYFICLLQALSHEIKECPFEVETCKWIDIDEWMNHDFKVETQKRACEMAFTMIKEFRESAEGGNHLSSILTTFQVGSDAPTLSRNCLLHVHPHFSFS
jgi:8-oxo-dGTP pyrophosphatase MutT (NUDIX family)